MSTQRAYIATLNVGNTLTIRSQTFFKGRPTVIADSTLVDYLKNHPNFTVTSQEVETQPAPAPIPEAIPTVVAPETARAEAHEAHDGAENTTPQLPRLPNKKTTGSKQLPTKE